MGHGIQPDRWLDRREAPVEQEPQVSKRPSPRADQLRALREAKFARHEQLRKEAEKAAAPAKSEPKKSKAKKKGGR
jgi:hypothetical protein